MPGDSIARPKGDLRAAQRPQQEERGPEKSRKRPLQALQGLEAARETQDVATPAFTRDAAPSRPRSIFAKRRARPAKTLHFASRPVRRALLTPQANPGSLYRSGKST